MSLFSKLFPPRMDPKRQLQCRKVGQMKKYVIEEAGRQSIPLDNVEFVIPFVSTDFSLGVYFFFKKKSDLSDESKTAIQKLWAEALKETGYFKDFPDELDFVFDSFENVQENYEGSYFLRMRG